MGLLQLVFQFTIVFMMIYLVIRAIYLGTHQALREFFKLRFETFTIFVLAQRNDDDGYMLLYLFPISFWWYALPYFLYHKFIVKDAPPSVIDLYGLIARTENDREKLATKHLEPLQNDAGGTTEAEIPSPNTKQ